MELIAQYLNGNTKVSIYEDGTKVREYNDIAKIIHPESIDVKITDYCDLGCSYCHESSTKKGIHANLDVLLNIISELPAGIELAIGGGNPLSHPDLVPFLYNLKEKGFIANLTVNQGHLKIYQDLLIFLLKENLIKGLGISITSNNFKHIKPLSDISSNIVYHLIAGVNDIVIIDKLMELGDCKVLILGYKKFGFGINYHSEEIDSKILDWKKKIHTYIGKAVLSFDNLAIEQLNVKRLFTHEGWKKFYMGDDFCFTMYIDAVKQEYAPTSRSLDRTSFKEKTLLEYFKNNDL